MSVRVYITISNYPCPCGVCKELDEVYDTIEDAREALQKLKETGYPDSYGFVIEDNKIVGAL